MNDREMLLSFFTISRQGTKRVPHSRKGTNIRSNNLHTTLSRDGSTRRSTSRAQPTCNGIRATHSTNALTINSLRTQQSSSQRSPGEFSRTESPTPQGEAPANPDVFVSSRTQPTRIIYAVTIEMVLKTYPVRCRVAWLP